MRRTLLLCARELRRFAAQPSSYVLAAIFFLAQAVFFCLLVDSLMQPQPQHIPPLRIMYSGGYLLVLFCFFIPALAMRSFAEERSRGTYDTLASLGAGRVRIAVAKYLANVLVFACWQVPTLLFPLLLWGSQGLDLAVLAVAFGALLLVSALWIALAMLASCRTEGVMPAYVVGCMALFCLWFFPYLRAAFPDPLYRPLFDVLNFDLILGRSSRGFLNVADLLLLIGGSLLLVALSAHILEMEKEKGRPGFLRRARAFWPPCAAVALMYLAMYIALHYGLQWDLSLAGNGRLSPEYRRLLRELPQGITMKAILPRSANVNCFPEARELILRMAEQSAAEQGGISLSVLDPDLDLAEMERLRESHDLPANVIGGLVIFAGGRSVSIPYHQLISISYEKTEGQPRAYISSFHGEEQLASAFRTLVREGGARALVLSGAGGLDLRSSERQGASLFAEMLGQMGVEFKIVGPAELSAGDPLQELSSCDLVIYPDPRSPPTEGERRLLEQAFVRKTPVLAALGPMPDGSSWPGRGDAFSSYGVRVDGRVIVQNCFRIRDCFTLPLDDYSNHPLVQGMPGSTLLFSLVLPVSEGVAADPRITAEPLVRTARDGGIWAEDDPGVLKSSRPGVPDGKDALSPLPAAYAVRYQGEDGIKPMLVLIGSRSPFENRFIYEGANRHLLFKSVNWLLYGGKELLLPPRRPGDYRLDLEPRRAVMVQVASLAIVPGLLLLMAGLVWWRRR